MAYSGDNPTSGGGAPVSRQSGFTLLEVVFAAGFIAIAFLGLLGFTVSVSRLEIESRDTSSAVDAVRLVVERLQGVEFDDLYASFNGDPADDPEGPGTASGAWFQLELDRATGGAAGGPEDGNIVLDVTVSFPEDGDGDLSELAAPLIAGMPTDLNGDGNFSGGSRADDYRYLPAVIRVEWDGPDGRRSLSIPRVYTKEALVVSR